MIVSSFLIKMLNYDSGIINDDAIQNSTVQCHVLSQCFTPCYRFEDFQCMLLSFLVPAHPSGPGRDPRGP